MLLKGKIPLSYTLGKIKYEVLSILGYSILVWLLYHNFHFVRIAIPLSVPAILGTVISLLLGFRSNQAYDRWWEARHIWGAIVNDSRTLARQAGCFMDKEYKEDEIIQFRAHFINRQIAWCHSLGQTLRGMNPIQGLEKWLKKKKWNTL
jgi:putative membrane protein